MIKNLVPAKPNRIGGTIGRAVASAVGAVGRRGTSNGYMVERTPKPVGIGRMPARPVGDIMPEPAPRMVAPTDAKGGQVRPMPKQPAVTGIADSLAARVKETAMLAGMKQKQEADLGKKAKPAPKSPGRMMSDGSM